MRLFDFGRNYAKNYASIIRQGLVTTYTVHVLVGDNRLYHSLCSGNIEPSSRLNVHVSSD